MSAALLIQIAVKVSILLAMAWLTTRAMRRSSAAARHFVWVIAILGILLVPAMVLVGPAWQVRVLPVFAVAAEAEPAPAPPDEPPTHSTGSGLTRSTSAGLTQPTSSTVSNVEAPLAQSLEEPPVTLSSPVQRTETAIVDRRASSSESRARMGWQPWLLGLWAAGVTVVLFRLGIGLIWVCWITRRAERMTDAAWLTILEDVTTMLRFRGRVSLRRSDWTTIPVACGLWRPTLLMPLDADEWSADRRRVVLLHELAHVKRRDCRLQALAQLAYAWHWFNPLAHMAVAGLRAEQERACDDLVLAAGTDGPSYADHLFEIARAFRSDPLPRWAMLAMASPSQLEGRVLAILDTEQRRHAPSRLVRVTVATLAAAAVLSLGAFRLSAATDASPMAAGEAAESALVERETQIADTQIADTRVEVDPVVVEPSTIGLPADLVALDRPLLAAQGPGVTINPWLDRLPLEPQFDFVLPFDPDPDPDPNPDFDFHFDFNFDPLPPVLGLPGVARAQAAADAVPEETRRRVADALSLALNDENERVRQQAIQGLATMRDPRAVPALIKALQSRDAQVRRIAVSSLSQFDTPEAAQGLVVALKDENADVRRNAISALGRRRDDKYADALVGAMRDENPDVRRQAVAALARAGQSAAVVGALVQALKDSNADVRQRAAASLARTQSPEAVPGLIAALKDANPDVRQMSAVALGAIADPRAIDALTAALKDMDAEVRERAAMALSRIARGQRRGPGRFPVADLDFKQLEREVEKVHKVELEKVHKEMTRVYQEKASAASYGSLDPREMVDAAMRQADKAFKHYEESWRQLEQGKGWPQPDTKGR